jgi:hypothetical protein
VERLGGGRAADVEEAEKIRVSPSCRYASNRPGVGYLPLPASCCRPTTRNRRGPVPRPRSLRPTHRPNYSAHGRRVRRGVPNHHLGATGAVTGPNIMGTQRQRLRAIVTTTMASGVFLVAFWIYFCEGKQLQN